METRYSILAWKIPCAGEPGRLWSRGLQRVGHGRATGHKHTITKTCFLVTVTSTGWPAGNGPNFSVRISDIQAHQEQFFKCSKVLHFVKYQNDLQTRSIVSSSQVDLVSGKS